MGFLDLFGEDTSNIARILEADRRSGPCEDDCETTCPFIGILPEESDHEGGSPLDFDYD